MANRSSILAGGSVLLSGSLISQSLNLLRSIVLARLLGPEDFGIAAALMISVTLLTMVTDVSMERQLVQAPDGDDPGLQGTMHAVQAVRGAASTLALLLLAWPMAYLFDVPHVAWAFAVVALVPAIRGFQHLDIVRQQRQLKFLPATATELSAQVASVAVAGVAGWWWGDYRAALYATLAQSSVACLATYFLADRGYRWHWERAHVRRVWRFGWPLLLNGLLLFCIFQGDRFIIGNRLGLAALGWYAIAYNLTSTATSIFAKTNASLLLPLLSQVQDRPAEFNRRLQVVAQCVGLLGAVIGGGLILAGGAVIDVLYGPGFARAGAVLPWLAAAQGLWMIRVGPTIAALARSDPANSTFSNVFRATALPLAYWLSGDGWAEGVAIAALIGESVALAVCILRIRRKHEVPLKTWLVPACGAITLMAACAALAVLVPKFQHPWASLVTNAMLCVPLTAVALVMFPAARAMLLRHAKSVWPRRRAKSFEHSRGAEVVASG